MLLGQKLQYYFEKTAYLLNIVLRGQFWDGSLQIVYAVPSFRVLQADDRTGSDTARRQRRDCQLQPMRLW